MSSMSGARYALVAIVAACVIALLIDVAQPPRVLLVGDSITGQYGPTAAATLRHHGYDAEVRAYPGVGLLDKGPRINAPATLKRDLASAAARVVVAEFSGNYGIVDPPLAGTPLGSDGFYSAWQAQVTAFTRQATRDGASLVWLLAPPPIRGDTTVSAHLSTLYRSEVHGHVTVLDPAPAVSLLDRNGNLYAGDGRHLSANGVTVIATLVAKHVESHDRLALRVAELERSPVTIVLLLAAIAALAALLALRPPRPARRRPLRAALSAR